MSHQENYNYPTSPIQKKRKTIRMRTFAFLKRTIIHLGTLLITGVIWFLLFSNIIKTSNDIFNDHLLYLCTSVFTGALLAFLYLIFEKKLTDQLEDEKEEKFEESYKDIIKKSEENFCNLKKYHEETIAIFEKYFSAKPCVYCEKTYKCYSNRGVSGIAEKFSSSKNHIYLFTTNLGYFEESLTNIEIAIKQNPNIEIRILALNPMSPFVRLRRDCKRRMQKKSPTRMERPSNSIQTLSTSALSCQWQNYSTKRVMLH